jgi:hypothetical protein
VPTPHIFDFDETELMNYQPEMIDQLLVEQPALYVNQLRIAHNLDRWADNLETGKFSIGDLDDKYQQGYARALHEVAAHLWQGNYVEGGYQMVVQPRYETEA